MAAHRPPLSAGTGRQWQETRHPKDLAKDLVKDRFERPSKPRNRGPVRAPMSSPGIGTMAAGTMTTTRRPAIAHGGFCRDRIPGFIGLATISRRCSYGL